MRVSPKTPSRRHSLLAAAGGAAVLALILLVTAFLEGDLDEVFGILSDTVQDVMTTYGAPASVGLLFIEESGIPLPIPGDVYVAYLGHISRESPLQLVAAWLVTVLAVIAGSSCLYMVARRWGHRLVATRLAPALHLERGRMERVEGWFGRWGAIAIIFGRHIPGFRIPVTVMAGIFEVPYRVFAPSVAVSTAVWAGAWVWLGARYGPTVAHVLVRHTWLYPMLVAAVAVVAALFGVRMWRASAKSSK